jgi:hypothetical protein
LGYTEDLSFDRKFCKSGASFFVLVVCICNIIIYVKIWGRARKFGIGRAGENGKPVVNLANTLAEWPMAIETGLTALLWRKMAGMLK